MKKVTIILMLALMVSVAVARQPFHNVQVKDEDGRNVTTITSVEIYAPDTTTDAVIYADRAEQNVITLPMTTTSTNTTLSNGNFYWYGPDGYDFSITDGTNIHTNADHLTRTASSNQMTFPSYLTSISSTTYSDAESATFGTSGDWVLSAGAVADRFTAIPATADTSAFWIGSTSFPADFNLWGATSAYNVIWDASENTLEILDNVVLAVGTGDDYTITHAPNTTTIAGTHTVTGVVTQQGDVLFDGAAADIRWDASEDTMGFLDDSVLGFGNTAAAPDIEVKWDQTDLDVTAVADGAIWKWGNGTNDFDMWWYGGAVGDYMLWDEGAAELTFVDAHAQFNDDGTLTFGTDSDFSVYSDTALTLEFDPLVAGNTIKFGTADTDAVDMIWYGDVSGDTVTFNEELNQVEFEDSELQMMDDTSFQLGDTAGGDASVEYDTDTHNAVLWAGAGHIGDLKIIEAETGTTETVLATESGKVFTTAAGVGTTTYTLPAAAAGLWFTFIDRSVVAGDDLKITAGTGDAIVDGAAAGSYHASGDEAVANVTLVAIDAGSWEVFSQTGTWTAL